MWIYEPSKVNNDLYMLGTKANPLYLLKTGQEWLLIDGGMLRDAALVQAQLKAVVPDVSHVRHWFVTHSHFDHCGLLANLLPDATLYASATAIKNLLTDKYRAFIYKLQRSFVPGDTGGHTSNPYDALATKKFVPVGDGDVLTIGEHTFTVLATPGHSDCSLSLYSDHQYLFAADAFGEMIGPDDWFPLPFQSPPQYLQSIERLRQLSVSLVAVGHHGLLTGEHAAQIAGHSLRTTHQYIQYFGDMLHQHGMEEGSRLITEKYGYNSSPFFTARMHQTSVQKVMVILQETGYITQ
ncbi:MBL fold metallo-hydrolase [Chitinophaga varians]|uniref:MBL fold metallo-hydrolase n=1 Tax=Chitinophaga varians TaxID=2202339 RepID=A0A847S8B0_9BACT|nr:MBL fold metallo-hydrolase [Chitinophaga varians]NLR68997.1 MBL fold metallo-hydrolase [Chitinophaga varians]